MFRTVGGELEMRMGELLFAVLLVIIGFIMVLMAQALAQFLGIIVIVIGIGVAIFSDLRKPASVTHH